MTVKHSTTCDLCNASTDWTDLKKLIDLGWEQARWIGSGGGVHFNVDPIDVCPDCADDRGWH